MTEQKSELARAIESRERRTYEFEAANFLGLGKKPIGKYAIRVVTKSEQDTAVLAAHKYVDSLAKGEGVDPSIATGDRDILTDAKTCHILYAACRDAKDPKYPAFPGPLWMMQHLSTDEISCLLNHYNEALRLSGALESDFSADRVEALAVMLAEHADTDVPNVYLMRFTREQIGELCVLLALKLSTERAAVELERATAADPRATSPGA
jgi:hypothetical protein